MTCAVRISALAEEFQVTTETIRRDLDELSARGLISRTYGGAAPRSLTGEPGVTLRAQAHVAERAAHRGRRRHAWCGRAMSS